MPELAHRAIVISSDGHATAKMADYKPYLARQWHESFDEFVRAYEKEGAKNFEAKALLMRCDRETVDEWIKETSPDRLDGNSDPAMRIKGCDEEGIAGEILFPDFGLPFEMYPTFHTMALNYPLRTNEQIDAANSAYNRWLVDFVSYAPERFAPMAAVRFGDVQAAIAEIQWAANHGFKGIVLPTFDAESPVYHPRFDPIWSLLEDLNMVANAHTGVSAIGPQTPFRAPLPHPQLAFAMYSAPSLCRGLLSQMIWGAVLERHPKLQLVITEVGSSWVISEIRGMDHSYEGSYMSRDIREVIRHKPSEYFHRQCHLGSSVFSRAELAARHQIGVDNMMLGFDYPHHEGAWSRRAVNYLQATVGAVGVPEDEARKMLGETALSLFGFDRSKLTSVAEQIGPTMEEVLAVPVEDLFPRGDVHRPL